MKHHRLEMDNKNVAYDDTTGSPFWNGIEHDTLLIGDESNPLFSMANLDSNSPTDLEEPGLSLGDLEFKATIDLNNPATSIGPPPRGDFPGLYSFDVSLSGETTNKKKYVYSSILNRVYLNMMSEIPVIFKYDWQTSGTKRLVIRATPILARSEHQEDRLLRCTIHKELTDASNRDLLGCIIPHVLRSARQGQDVYYCGSEQVNQSWLSVCFEPPSQPSDGVTSIQHVYKFCCKHSCISGINRRPVEVLFTLENFYTGEILGRSSLGVRVCSCPKRDLEKDEEEYRLQNNTGPPCKKKRLQPPSTHQPNNATVNTNFHLVRSLYDMCMAASSSLPADFSARPSIQNLARELGQLINNSKV